MGNAAYDAAKAAVIGFTRTLSRSLGPDGIRVNVVAPGSIYTERVSEVFSGEFLDRQTAAHSAARACRPDDVAAPGLFPFAGVGPDQRGGGAGQRRAIADAPKPIK